MGRIDIKKAQLDDLQLLFDTCRLSYIENFAHHWNDGGLELYLRQVFSLSALKTDLLNSHIHYYFACLNTAPIGFIKINLDPKPSFLIDQHSMEIEKLYVRPAFQFKGVGNLLMNTAIDQALAHKKTKIFLDVIDSNTTAIEFYRNKGFDFLEKRILDFPLFKDELRGMWRMILIL